MEARDAVEELNTSLRAEYLRGGVTVCVSPLIFAFVYVLGAGIPRAMDVVSCMALAREERKTERLTDTMGSNVHTS